MGKSVYIIVAFLILKIYCIAAEQESSESDRILSRRRRYLIFPEGSSLQLVYDQIVPVVDYTNLFVFGLTVAMAWQLPDKTQYPDKKIDKISRKNGMAKNRKNATKSSHQKTSNIQFEHYNPQSYHNYDMQNNYRTFLLGQIANKLKTNRYYYPVKGFERMDYGGNFPSKNVLNLIKQYNDTRFVRNKLKHQRHFLYPVLRRRREVMDVMERSSEHELDICHYNQHVLSRNDLYDSVSRYLEAKGENGTDCVMRAICETTKISSALPAALPAANSYAPSSLVKEILRVIFSLPDLSNYKYRNNGNENCGPIKSRNIYASNSDENCSLKYPKCSGSYWSSEFIL